MQNYTITKIEAYHNWLMSQSPKLAYGGSSPSASAKTVRCRFKSCRFCHFFCIIVYMKIAYSKALAWESIPDSFCNKFDQNSGIFSGITHDELERYARIVAYKVAYNLRNGASMNFDLDPLKYGGDPNYPRNPSLKIIRTGD